jgi:hypothetical protein
VRLGILAVGFKSLSLVNQSKVQVSSKSFSGASPLKSSDNIAREKFKMGK